MGYLLSDVAHLPTDNSTRGNTPIWNYELEDGPHTLRLRIVDSGGVAELKIHCLIYYGNAPRPAPAFDTM